MNHFSRSDRSAIVLLTVVAVGSTTVAALAFNKEGWSLGVGIFVVVAAVAFWGAVSSTSSIRRFVCDLFSSLL
jgi:hypothetical protein